MVKKVSVPVEIVTISTGKFRRYMDMALWKQVLHPDIGGRNLVDMFKVAGGVAQSIRLMRRVKPNAVFAKGGYVSLPIGYAAHLLRIPLIIHDSDARPGLTNRVLSRWASRIATGTPVTNYRYNAELSQHTGVPIDAAFYPYSPEEQKAAKKALGLSVDSPLVAVAGPSLGAKDISNAMVEIAPDLKKKGISVFHVTGKKAFEDIKSKISENSHYKLVPFVYEGLASVFGAADVVVTRASATALQELAASAKPVIAVPNASLGDQLENAKKYAADGAATVIFDEDLESNPRVLLDKIVEITTDKKMSDSLSSKIFTYAKRDAAEQVAKLIWESKREGRGKKRRGFMAKK